jgi:hydrogenase large subunit
LCTAVFSGWNGTVYQILGGTMSEIITINPITRISGYLEIKAEVNNNVIVNAEADGLLYRGFETMLKGRPPADAVFFTERICGICSAAHAMASTLAVENAINATITQNDKYVRDVIHGLEFVQNHLRHFYLFTVPDFVKMTNIAIAGRKQFQDYRLPDELNQLLEQHYVDSIRYSRLSHEAQAVFGGKAPHNHGIFVCGAPVIVDAYKLTKVKSLLHELTDFVNNVTLADINIIARYYPDYYQKGISYDNFLSYGVFENGDADISYLGPAAMINGVRYPLQADQITEQIKYAWYVFNQTGDQDINLSKPDAYTFVKAPRYQGLPMEVGPLARLLITGEYTGGHSCMDRYMARILEIVKVLSILNNLIDRIEVMPSGERNCEIPETTQGAGMVDTTRGALGHWINIENHVIQNYNIIPPSVWNLSARDDQGNLGVVERALIGTTIGNMKEPVEIGRIVRSYDPCVSCATHLINERGDKTVVEVLA